MRKISVSPWVCVYAALTILLLPLKWILAAFIAAVFHEFCHILAVHLCGGRLRGFRIGGRGAVLHCDGMTTGRTLVCVLAGPLGSLLLVTLFRWIPRIAICALFQVAYNLLPIYPLDGGRAVRCICAALKNRP